MHLEPIEGLPKLNHTPLAVVHVESPRVLVDLDDESEARLRLVFEPYQAIRVITDDCFDLPGGLSIIPQRVVEVVHSPWIEELKAVLKRVDHTATFLERARHFLIPAQDDFIEVVAWAVTAGPAPVAPE